MGERAIRRYRQFDTALRAGLSAVTLLSVFAAAVLVRAVLLWWLIGD